MPINNDNSDHEAKRIEERRQLEKQQAKANQEKDPLRSFEAKLSTQASREEAARSSWVKSTQDIKKENEEKAGVLKKVLGDKADESAADLSTKIRHHEKAFAEQKGLQKKVVGDKLRDKLEEKKDKREGEEGGLSRTKDEDAAQPEQKVVGVLDDESSQEGGAFSGGGSFGDSSKDSDAHDFEDGAPTSLSEASGPIQASSSGSSEFSGGSGGASSGLSNEDFDVIVKSVQHAFLQNGEEIFSVELSQDFFEGLQIQAVRTSAGVVVSFVCPNVLVRTHMARCRDEIMQRFSDKNIAVQDVKFL